MGESKRTYPLGNRVRPAGFREGKDTVGESTFAWTTNELGRFVILVNETENQVGPAIRLFHPIPGKRFNISWELTMLTEDEFDALKEIVMLAFDMALPIIRARDKEAADALAAGDDSYHRIYRAVPQVVYRKGPQQKYSESLLHGLEDAADVESADSNSDGELRGRSDGVAERDEGGSEPQDNGEASDESTSVRSVDGEPDSS